jgi:hypothetical protein
MGKVATFCLDDQIEGEGGALLGRTSNALPEEQCGARAGKGTDMASHQIRTAVDVAVALGWSLLVLFLDLTKAFDFALREVVIGWPQYHQADKVEYMQSLGLSAEQAADVAEQVDQGAVFDQIRVHRHVTRLTTSLHTGSWFTVGNHHLSVAKGGRQGCRLGAKIFNLAYEKPLARFRQEMSSKGIITRIRFRYSLPFGFL